jgi:hypothetical protein
MLSKFISFLYIKAFWVKKVKAIGSIN